MRTSHSKLASAALTCLLLGISFSGTGHASAPNPGQFPHKCVNDDNLCPTACCGIGDNDCDILNAVESAERFLRTHERGGSHTPDAREDSLQPRSEVYRLLHGSQAAGYLDLYEATGKAAYLREAVERLDALLASEGVWSNKEWDGDLGYVFLRGYEATGKPEFLGAGMDVAERLATYCWFNLCELNPGLSAAICLAEAYRVSGNPRFLYVARPILARTQSYQHKDGSFPHQLSTNSRNLAYSSWKAFQLWTYLRLDPGVRTAYVTGTDHNGGTVVLDFDSMMSLLLSFLKRQVNADGTISYSGGWESQILLDPECKYCSSPLYPRCKAYCEERCGPPPGGTDAAGPCWCIEDPLTECGGKLDAPGHPVSSAPDVLCAYCSSSMYASCADSCKEACPTSPSEFPCGCVAAPETDCPRDTVWNEITYFDEADPNYDTRGWTSELASTAFALARAGEHDTKWKVLRFLFSLQNKDDSFPDKWGYKTEQPGTRLWLWASNEHSAMRTSIIFRVLASLLVPQDSAGLAGPTRVALSAGGTPAQTTAATHDPTAPTILRVSPNPSVRGIVLTLLIPDDVRTFGLRLVDVTGRTIRTFAVSPEGDGFRTGGSGTDTSSGAVAFEIHWDGRNDSGDMVSPGVYFAQLYSDRWQPTKKIVMLGH